MQEILRCEKKFVLNWPEFIKKENQLQKILHEDSHNGTYGYNIRSLYFDTAYDEDFFDKIYGTEVRKKIRLRIYEPSSAAAALEMKQKQGEQQKKRSLRIGREDAQRLINCDYTPLLNYSDPFAAECYALMNTRCYQPRAIIQYRRKAFIAQGGDVRITFDYHIGATSSNFDLFSPYLSMIPVIDPSHVLLEVKYNGFLLSYIKESLASLEKSEQSVSKYCMARQIEYFSNL